MQHKKNLEILLERKVKVLGPGTGDQACGDVGPGRMLEPEEIVAAISSPVEASLSGRQVLVTAGPTIEDIDPVRFIGNRSSGKMGFALAAAARKAGANVTLIAGPCSLPTPPGVERRDVRSAAQMHETVLSSIADADVFIGVAAVADYTPANTSASKLKKGLPRQRVELVATADIIADVAALEHRPYTVGFAAETNDVIDYAKDKLLRKGLDMIAANRVGTEGSGFGSDENEISLLFRDNESGSDNAVGQLELGSGTKRRLAGQIIEQIARQLRKSSDIEDDSDKSTRPAAG